MSEDASSPDDNPEAGADDAPEFSDPVSTSTAAAGDEADGVSVPDTEDRPTGDSPTDERSADDAESEPDDTSNEPSDDEAAAADEAATDDDETDEIDAAADDETAGVEEGAETPDDAADDAVDDASDDSVDDPADDPLAGVPEDVRTYDRFKKMDGAQYERVNSFLRDRTYITAREWAIARLCADFRTETGVEMTKIGDNLPMLVPFMTDTYTPQAVNQARSAFEEKVRMAGATFLYGAMSDFFTADQLDDLMYEVTEVAKFLLEVEGVDLAVADELEAEERISSVMREVRRSSDELRNDGVVCPNCGHEHGHD